MSSVILAIIIGAIAGPLVAWSLQNPKQLRTHEEKKAKFEAGRGKDPERWPYGPHKPFTTNAVILGVVIALAFGIAWPIGTNLGETLGHLVMGGGAS